MQKELGLMEKTIEDYEREYDFEYLGDAIAIYKYLGNAPVVEIPSRIGECRVVRIESKAFYYCNVVSVIIPETVEAIGANAFENCVYLQSVTILSKNSKIGVNAFLNCPDLTIHGVSGGKVEKYAKANKINFQKTN
jgi:hypothetical protein